MPNHFSREIAAFINRKRICRIVDLAGNGNKISFPLHTTKQFVDDKHAEPSFSIFRGNLYPFQNPFADAGVKLRNTGCNYFYSSLIFYGNPKLGIIYRMQRVSLQISFLNSAFRVTFPNTLGIIGNTDLGKHKAIRQNPVLHILQKVNQLKI